MSNAMKSSVDKDAVIELPENGYTPNNYAALVEHTSLTNAAFCRAFDIPEQTFYKHYGGSRTMKWQDWQALLKSVKTYMDKKDKG